MPTPRPRKTPLTDRANALVVEATEQLKDRNLNVTETVTKMIAAQAGIGVLIVSALEDLAAAVWDVSEELSYIKGRIER